MNDLKAFAADNVKRLDGRQAEDAYHRLVEADGAIIPFLIEAFRSAHSPSVRADLVMIVWQHRLPETVEFLAEALNDPVTEVRKCALDGLVTLGGQPAIQALESARRRGHYGRRAPGVPLEWIDEAIQQIRGRI